MTRYSLLGTQWSYSIVACCSHGGRGSLAAQAGIGKLEQERTRETSAKQLPRLTVAGAPALRASLLGHGCSYRTMPLFSAAEKEDLQRVTRKNKNGKKQHVNHCIQACIDPSTR